MSTSSLKSEGSLFTNCQRRYVKVTLSRAFFENILPRGRVGFDSQQSCKSHSTEAVSPMLRGVNTIFNNHYIALYEATVQPLLG
jgi:hypothetical protein